MSINECQYCGAPDFPCEKGCPKGRQPGAAAPLSRGRCWRCQGTGRILAGGKGYDCYICGGPEAAVNFERNALSEADPLPPPPAPTFDSESAIRALEDAGWTKQSRTVWRSPEGGLFRGPAGAYREMLSRKAPECAHGHTSRVVGCVSCVLVFDRPAAAPAPSEAGRQEGWLPQQFDKATRDADAIEQNFRELSAVQPPPASRSALVEGVTHARDTLHRRALNQRRAAEGYRDERGDVFRVPLIMQAQRDEKKAELMSRVLEALQADAALVAEIDKELIEWQQSFDEKHWPDYALLLKKCRTRFSPGDAERIA